MKKPWKAHAELGKYAKERPKCRAMIQAHQLRPFLTESGEWDGLSASSPDRAQVFLSQGMETQMRKMITEGYWPDLYAGIGY